ncbi:tRNA (adenosine(37)-N6)-threonylcarbamoyltransferase complex ATPase subunit type 1 TsaE [Amphibacillus sp. Q70]|uniref:tRNA (adenosine(37)-N6)-threonylcarbamoyltransferase complex ATPase subunit type 1 TsaE n=1 Tax=Amphibacillus sp. Q70 TaxID=3453416 RepID=UPI003F834C20
MKTIKLRTELETKRLARKLALLLRPNDVVTLIGELGAGKTTFTKGIGEGLGVKRTINSPTFTIVKSYQGELVLHHIDAYRLEDSDEDIGFDEYFYDDGITVVEWPQFIESYLPEEHLELMIERLDGNERLITLKPRGSFFEIVCEELMR